MRRPVRETAVLPAIRAQVELHNAHVGEGFQVVLDAVVCDVWAQRIDVAVDDRRRRQEAAEVVGEQEVPGEPVLDVGLERCHRLGRDDAFAEDARRQDRLLSRA